VRWEDNVRAIGHGTSTQMNAEEALARARKMEPASEIGVGPNDPQELHVGKRVTVNPDLDGGEQPVEGKLRCADAHSIGIERTTEEVGTVCVHFPRAGYRVTVN
ncbi:MAG: glutathione S-transferase family protein, partial [Roseobacter sp.]